MSEPSGTELSGTGSDSSPASPEPKTVHPRGSATGELPPVDPLDTRRYQIAIRRLADTLNYGTDRSRFLGSGIEYVQSRPYQPGDPVRSIDWRVTARTGEVYVKDYEAPKSIPAWILVDTSASMTLSSVAKSKYQMALQLAGGIAFALLDKVSPVGVLGVGSREVRFNPSLNRGKVMEWLHDLRRYRYDEATTLGERLTELRTRLGSKALVVVISDLHEPDGVAALKLVGQEHDVVAIQLRDPAEEGIRGVGFLRGQEAETGMRFTARGGWQRLDGDAARNNLRRGGVDHLLLYTHQPVADKLRRFFETRGLGGGGGR